MTFTIPWLNKRRDKAGRVGVAVGPDGLAVAYVEADGTLGMHQFYDQSGDIESVLTPLVEAQNWQGLPCSMVLHPIYYKLLLNEAPPVQGDEMVQAVRWKVKDLLDYSLDEAAIDHFPLPDDAFRGRQKMLYAAALRKATLESLVTPVENSGLAVDCVEVTELAVHHLTTRMGHSNGGMAMLHLLDSQGLINLVEDNSIYLCRGLSVGLEQLRNATDKTQVLDTLLLDIQRSLDYYESQLGKGIITHLYYSPALPEMLPVGEYLSLQLGLNIAPLNLADTVTGTVDDQSARCTSAIGAALGPCSVKEVSNAAH